MVRLIPPTLQGDAESAHDEDIVLRAGARDQAHLRSQLLAA